MRFSRLTKIMLLTTLSLLIAVGTVFARKSDEQRPFVLVIDPGHGGKDFGCRGTKANEKTIVLNVGKLLGSMIEKELGDSVKVIFTRDDDTFIPLDSRAAIANEAAADFFMSIHVNSVDRRSKGRKSVHGASVYTVGLHKSEANLAVAMRENGVIELEQDYSTTYQGFDPSSSESYIIFELDQNRHMEQSIEMASIIQNELISTAGRADKGVRQAGFLVLWATRMPSVLVELDFICNPEAERFLWSEKGQEKCAMSLFNAFKTYRNKHPRNTQASK